MRARIQSRCDGIALIIVLIVVVVLGILAGGFAYSMRVETMLARNASLDADLEWLGRSGVELAKYVLAEEAGGPSGQFDSMMKKWAGGPGDTNSPVAAVTLDHYPLGAGSFSVKIVDYDRKFNINVADEVILKQALTLIGVDAAAQPTVVDSILDWRDPDNNRRNNGTESDQYENQSPPYFAKNGAIDDLSELLLVSGVTPAMYWGSGVGGHMQVLNRQPGVMKSKFEEPTYEIGLVDLFTPLSSRLINVNTATATTLQVIPEIDANVANAIISGPGGRAGPDGADGTEDDMPFRSPQELSRIPGFANPAAIGQLSRFFTVRSLVFEVRVDAQIGSYRRQFVAVVRRNSARDMQTLSFYWR